MIKLHTSSQICWHGIYDVTCGKTIKAQCRRVLCTHPSTQLYSLGKSAQNTHENTIWCILLSAMAHEDFWMAHILMVKCAMGPLIFKSRMNTDSSHLFNKCSVAYINFLCILIVWYCQDVTSNSYYFGHV